MKAAFAHWDDRIAPVFDVARHVYLVEVDSGCIVQERHEVFLDDLPVQKVMRLAELGVGMLVCGAISRPLHEMVLAYGIRVIPFIAGDLREVIRAWLRGELDRNVFAMPGCAGGARRGGRGKRGMYQEGYIMNGRQGGGMGGGRGRGQGRGGRRPGRMGGPLGAGPAGNCLCPQCGHREPHGRGLPCFERSCPQCGTVMVRE